MSGRRQGLGSLGTKLSRYGDKLMLHILASVLTCWGLKTPPYGASIWCQRVHRISARRHYHRATRQRGGTRHRTAELFSAEFEDDDNENRGMASEDYIHVTPKPDNGSGDDQAV